MTPSLRQAGRAGIADLTELSSPQAILVCAARRSRLSWLNPFSPIAGDQGLVNKWLHEAVEGMGNLPILEFALFRAVLR